MKRVLIGGLLLSTVVWGGYRIVDRSHPAPPPVAIEQTAPVVAPPVVVVSAPVVEAPKPAKPKPVARKAKPKPPAVSKPAAPAAVPAVKKAPDSVLPVSCAKVRWYNENLSASSLESLESVYKPTPEQKRAALACLKQ